jgi:hypothetical protein
MTSPQVDSPHVDFDSGIAALGSARNEGSEENDRDGTVNPNVIQVNHHSDVVFTEDPQFVEHQHIQHQSLVHVEDREPTAFEESYRHRSGYVTHESPVWDTGRMAHQEQWPGAGGNRTKDARRNTIRSISRKTAKYKSTYFYRMVVASVG